MPIVLLVRHGQASFGGDDYDRLSAVGRPPSAVGRRQAERTGRWLVDRGLRRPVAVHGSLRRQRDPDPGPRPRRRATADRAPDRSAVGRVRPHRPGPSVRGRAWQRGTPQLSRVPNPARRGAGRLGRARRGGGWPAFSGGVTGALRELVRGLQQGQDAVVITSAGIIATVCAGPLGTGAAGLVALNRVAVNGGVTKLVVGRPVRALAAHLQRAHSR